MNIYEQLANVQAKLKAPKGQHNDYGNYNYRSCEDIFEAVKPILADEKLTLLLDDSIEMVGTRIYVKATATLKNSEGAEIVNHAFARESETKKGMDGSQITGAASSYARKYALNGLFLIDDTKDADTDEFQKQQVPKGIDEAKQTTIMNELHRTGWNLNAMLTYLREKFPSNPPASISKIDEKQFAFIIRALEKKPDKKTDEEK